MVKVARLQEFLLRLDIDLVITIFSLVLKESFLDFTNYFRTWCPYQTPAQINTLLHHLDWTKMHVHDNPLNPPAYDRFNAFLALCKDKNINHAFCYNASKDLLLGRAVEENLNVLHQIAHQHPPSFVAYHVFSSIYKPTTIDICSTTLLRNLGNLHFRAQLQSSVELMRNRRIAFLGLGWEPRPRFIPEVPLCSFATTTSPQHFQINRWPPTYANVLSCRCSNCFLQMLWYIIFDEY